MYAWCMDDDDDEYMWISRHRDFWIFGEFDQKDQLYDMLNKQRMDS